MKIRIAFVVLVLGSCSSSEEITDEEMFGPCIKWTQPAPIYVKAGEVLIPIEQEPYCIQYERSAAR